MCYYLEVVYLNLVTTSKYKDKEMEVEMWFNPDETFSPDLGCLNRFRLVFIQKGTGILNLNGYRFAFLAPIIFFINEQDQIIMEESINITAQALYFHPSIVNFAFNFDNIRKNTENMSQTDQYDIAWLSMFLESNLIPGRYLSVGPSSYSRINQLFENIYSELNSQENRFWACRTRSYLLELLIFLRQLPKFTETLELTESSSDINSVLLYIHNNYEKKITVPELAQKFNTNRTTLSEKFYEATGISIGAYLVRKRMEVAAAFIRDTNLPVMEIFHRVGFNNISHFITAFRKHYHISPKEYRAQYSCMK